MLFCVELVCCLVLKWYVVLCSIGMFLVLKWYVVLCSIGMLSCVQLVCCLVLFLLSNPCNTFRVILCLVVTLFFNMLVRLV